MDCEVCTNPFNESDHKPRNLRCGHSFCTSCLKNCIKNKSICCPKCREKTDNVEVHDLTINFPVLDIVKQASSLRVAQDNSPKESLYFAQAQGLPSLSQKERKWSPHGGMCLHIGAVIEFHCAKCQVWLCEDCSKIDHGHPNCLVTPQQETLSQMMHSKTLEKENACRKLMQSQKDIQSYGDRLKSCEIIMSTALDCIKKEHKRLENLIKECINAKDQLQNIPGFKRSHNLPETLSSLQGLNMAVSDSRKWAAGVLSTLLDDKAFKLAKLECVKSCIDTKSTVIFLDLSWSGSCQGRVFIRLIGQSTRARQFLMMCLGDKGPTICRTHFHRVWWRGQPGEHIWAGDYDKGNGSGGVLPSDIAATYQQGSPSNGQKLPITAGLVAGVYGRDRNSSIFRIYTKESSDTIEEAAFGKVEQGLQILRAAIQHNKITDVLISDCGVVIEP